LGANAPDWFDDGMALTAPGQLPGRDVAELQALADQATMLRLLRPSANANIVIGVVAILAGLGYFWPRTFGIILLVFGVALLGAGLAVRVLASPIGFVVDGITCALLAGFFAVGCLALAAAGKGTPFLAAASLVPAFWAVLRFRRFARFRHVPRAPMPEEVRLQLDAAHKELLMARAAHDPAVIELLAIGGPSKGRLHRDMAVFCVWTSLLFARPEDVVILAQEGGTGRPMKMEYAIADRTGKGHIQPESWERYKRWKAAHGMPVG